jgi:hypothetical protein
MVIGPILQSCTLVPECHRMSGFKFAKADAISCVTSGRAVIASPRTCHATQLKSEQNDICEFHEDDSADDIMPTNAWLISRVFFSNLNRASADAFRGSFNGQRMRETRPSPALRTFLDATAVTGLVYVNALASLNTKNFPLIHCCGVQTSKHSFRKVTFEC